ncbi:MAG: hypothetical protein GXY83_37360 [Rhodopirellula sp.]|nr:hypothetical protein [Rhodopirellula sp.]
MTRCRHRCGPFAGLPHISVRISADHQARMMNSFGVTTTADLVRHVICYGLIAPT